MDIIYLMSLRDICVYIIYMLKNIYIYSILGNFFKIDYILEQKINFNLGKKKLKLFNVFYVFILEWNLK